VHNPAFDRECHFEQTIKVYQAYGETLTHEIMQKAQYMMGKCLGYAIVRRHFSKDEIKMYRAGLFFIVIADNIEMKGVLGEQSVVFNSFLLNQYIPDVMTKLNVALKDLFKKYEINIKLES
jgi:hypothetical protein